jgi:hypothetical protein
LVAYVYFGLTGFILGLAVGSIAGVVVVKIWLFKNGIKQSFYELKLSVVFFLLIAFYYGSLQIIDSTYQKEMLAVIITLLAFGFLYYAYREYILTYIRSSR